jgi:hypothetical protein
MLCGAAAGLCVILVPAATAGETEKCDGNFNLSNLREETQQAAAFNDCIRQADEQRKFDEKEKQDRQEEKRANDQQISDAKALVSDIATRGVVEAIKSAGNTAVDRRIGNLMDSDAKSSDPTVQALQEHIDKAYDKLNMSDPVAKAFAATSTEKTVNIMSNAEGQLEAALRSAETLGDSRTAADANAIASFGTLRPSARGASNSGDDPAWNASVEEAQAQAQQAQAQAQRQAQQAQQIAERETAAANEQRRENAIISVERQNAEIQSEASQMIRQGEISGWARAAAAQSSSTTSSGAPAHDCEAIGPGHPMC